MWQLSDFQQQLRQEARSLAEILAPRAAEIDRSEAYPWDNVAALREAGFLGMTLPSQLGGRGLSYLDTVLVVEEIARACGASARIVVESNMGGVGAIMAYGTPAQKQLAAELVLSGDKPAICITEPEAGSAASDMQTQAVRRGGDYLINGHKHWITGGGVSRLHLIFARVVEDGVDLGIGGFIALAGEPGLRIGKREPAMGLRGIPETQVFLENLRLPRERLLLPPDGLSHGFARLMDAYNGQRVGAAAVALGLAARAYQEATDYLQTREQFGRPLCEFQGLQWMLVDMDTQLAAARTLVWQAAASAGAGFPDAMLAARAKLYTSEMAVKVTNDALQLHGAAGYSRDRPLERLVRDARMFTIAGGTAQVLRTVVASRLLKRKLPQTRDGYARQQASVAPVEGANLQPSALMDA